MTNKNNSNENSSNNKVAECGSCGKLVSASATECPFCKVKFETEEYKNLAECGSCNKLIPVTSTTCPYCNVVFDTAGIVEEKEEKEKKAVVGAMKKMIVEGEKESEITSPSKDLLLQEFELELDAWRLDGYPVTELEDAIKTEQDIRQLWKLFVEFNTKTQRVKKIRNKLKQLENFITAEASKSITEKLNNFNMLDAVEDELKKIELEYYLKKAKDAYQAQNYSTAVDFFDKVLELNGEHKEAKFYKKRSLKLMEKAEVKKELVVEEKLEPLELASLTILSNIILPEVKKGIPTTAITKPKLPTPSAGVHYKIIGKRELVRPLPPQPPQPPPQPPPSKVGKKTRLSLEELEVLGRTAYELKKYKHAIKYFDEILAINRENASIWNDKGVVLKAMGDYEGALNCYEQALKYKPNYLEALCNRGFLFEELKQYESAVESYLLAFKSHPTDKLAVDTLIACLINLRDKNPQVWSKLRRKLKRDLKKYPEISALVF